MKVTCTVQFEGGDNDFNKALEKEIKSKLRFAGAEQLRVKVTRSGQIDISGPEDLVKQARKHLSK